jgi:hypothetical protein
MALLERPALRTAAAHFAQAVCANRADVMVLERVCGVAVKSASQGLHWRSEAGRGHTGGSAQACTALPSPHAFTRHHRQLRFMQLWAHACS